MESEKTPTPPTPPTPPPTPYPVRVHDLLHRIVLALLESEIADDAVTDVLLRAADEDRILDVSVEQAVVANEIVEEIEGVYVLGGRDSGPPRLDGTSSPPRPEGIPAPAPTTETEIEGARYVNTHSRMERRPTLDPPLLLVVGGPDRDDEIMLLARGECYLPRETAVALVEELCRRLKVSVTSAGKAVAHDT